MSFESGSRRILFTILYLFSLDFSYLAVQLLNHTMSQMSNWARHVGGPLASQQAGVSMVLSRSFASKSKSKAEPSEDKTETPTAPPKFKYTPASYYPFPKEKADYVIAEYTKDAHEESALVKDYIGSRLLYITDPVLREEIRAREAEALVKDEALLKGHQAVIESDMDATKKYVW